jgi:hypothetical protein
VQDLPAVRFEPAPNVLGEGKGGLAVDRDVIVVVDESELIEPEVSASEAASLPTPSIMSPSLTNAHTRWSTISKPAG